ncbi:MAG: zinc ribbon domain-containing protein [Blastocatellia bacterium]|nr:zinc ribbon domain-containing protein [Chloracidobacterium sp.]MBL8185441.1 zinc ribbon domain-containing protein [Blastocatellia bacterium]HBE82281.1 hypothetical protein [Blastocatellia bacterium]HRJ89374.1 zinc ribbon domain-containing protein [Pyrinomonadaceae bacterium]HRK48831.1 zinc ribbon domain-containing protein [Pyrinomonadaceae bacterium]
MYCDRCGKQIDESLNFCKSCGAQLRKGDDQTKSILGSLVSALIAVAVVGLAILVGLMAILLDKVPNPEPVFIFAIFYLATLFGICFMIMRQISKLIDRKLGDPAPLAKTSSIESVPLVQLPPKATNPLDEFQQPASVTDHTTRTLEKVPVSER